MSPLTAAGLAYENQRYQVPTIPQNAGFSQGKVDKNSQLYKACEDFQAVFIKQMLDVMRKTVEKSDLVEHNQGEDIFEDMLYEQYSKNMSKTAGFDLADTMYRQMSWLQNLPKSGSH